MDVVLKNASCANPETLKHATSALFPRRSSPEIASEADARLATHRYSSKATA